MQLNSRANAVSQAPSCERFDDETPEQKALHHEIALTYRRAKRPRGRRRPAIVAFRIRDLQIVFIDRYVGGTMTDDDAGRDDLIVLLHHVARLGDPRALRDYAARWCPWLTHGEFAAMIAEIDAEPLRWRADSLARRIGLDDATRTRLGVTTIGSTDCNKVQRTKRAKRRDAAYQQRRRMKAGAKPRALSEARLKPWLALGISESTYRRRKRQAGSADSNSSGAALIGAGTTKHGHADQTAGPSRPKRDRPYRSGDVRTRHRCTADDERKVPAFRASNAATNKNLPRAAFACASLRS
jgi:hypothetical protein